MIDKKALTRVARVSWLVVGGVWGAWVGLAGIRTLPQNHDSFGTLFAQSLYFVFAAAGLCAGALCGLLIGVAVEKLLRLLRVSAAGALGGATLVTVVALWQIAALVQLRFPGLRPLLAKPTVSEPQRRRAENPCAQPPPENTRDRAAWNSECR